MTPRELRDLALARIDHAAVFFGEIDLEGLTGVAPVWRPLLAALAAVTDVRWRNPGTRDTGWFPGRVVPEPDQPASTPDVVSCANPRAEAVEALRWVRELLATGIASPAEIAICATATESWDEHFAVLAASGELPIHFSHGVVALWSREGQFDELDLWDRETLSRTSANVHAETNDQVSDTSALHPTPEQSAQSRQRSHAP